MTKNIAGGRSRLLLAWLFTVLLTFAVGGRALSFVLCNDADCPVTTAELLPKDGCCPAEKTPEQEDLYNCCSVGALPQMQEVPPICVSDFSSLNLIALTPKPVAIVPPVDLLIESASVLPDDDRAPPGHQWPSIAGRAPPVR